MPRERVSVRKIREILRLRWQAGLSGRQIASSCNLARSTVADYLRRAEVVGLGWPLPEQLDDGALEQALFPPSPRGSETPRAEPDWPRMHKELRRKSVTLALLWQEYKAACPEGYQYSWFCEHYLRITQGLLIAIWSPLNGITELESLRDVRLRVVRLRPGVIDVIDGEKQLVVVPVWTTIKLAPAVRQNSQEIDPLPLEQGENTIVEQIR